MNVGRTSLLVAALATMLTATVTFSQPAFLSSWGTPGSAPGQFNSPFGIAIDGSGNVFIADEYNRRVQKFDAVGNYLATIGAGVLDGPVGVAVMSGGDLLVANHFDSSLRRFSSAGALLGVVATAGNGPGQLSHPVCIAVDGADNIFVADWGHSLVQKYAADGTFVLSWTVPTVYGVAIGAEGVVYASSNASGRVDRFTSEGVFLGSIGAGQLVSPDGVSIDTDGGLLVADHGQSRVLKFDANGSLVYSFGSQGTAPGQFGLESPADVRVGPNGHIYATDWKNHRVEVFGYGTPPPPPPPGSPQICGEAAEGAQLSLTAPAGTTIQSIDFASYGTPTGSCGAYAYSGCNSDASMSVVMFACLGKTSCTIAADNARFGDPCYGTVKRLWVQASCGPAPTTARRTSWGSLKSMYR